MNNKLVKKRVTPDRATLFFVMTLFNAKQEGCVSDYETHPSCF